MSNPDSFLNEVAEEVRKDQMTAYVRRYGWIVALVVIVIVGGATFWEWRKAQAQAHAEAFGNGVIAAVGADSSGVAAVQLGEIAAEGDAAVLRDLMRAGLLAQDNSREAAEVLRAIIATEGVSQHYIDVARLRLVQLPDNPLMTDDRLAILDPLVANIGPFRLLALENRAMVYLEQRETDLAIADLQTVLADAESTPNQQQRAQQLLIALGVDPTLQ